MGKKASPDTKSPEDTRPMQVADKGQAGDKPDKQFNMGIVIPLVFVSMAGWMFGADTGTISGLTQMADYQQRFGVARGDGTYYFDPPRQGLVVGMVNAGTFFGCLLSAYPTERFGRRKSIMGWCLVYFLGLTLQLTAVNTWVHVMIARIITGLSIGALTVNAPSYQSELAPKAIRGAIVCTFQLFVTLGIFAGYLINYGTYRTENEASWRVPIAINFLWGIFLAVGMIFLPESPARLYKMKDEEGCKKVLAKIRGTDVSDPNVEADFEEIKEAVHKETEGGPSKWKDVFHKDVRYRTFLGIAVMSFQQLVGANFFFYFGTSTFTEVNIAQNYVAQIILGAVNFGCTFAGLYILERFGRRWPLIIGALWMCLCLLIFASVGHFKIALAADPTTERTSGIVLIVFTCLYIAAFSTTWAPAAYVIVGESFPLRVRAKCAALSTAANFFWGFLITFFTGFIVEAIDYRYGYVFAACSIIAALIIFFFAMETKGLSLEEIDAMYHSGIKAWQSEGFAKKLQEEREGKEKKDEEEGLTKGERESAQPREVQ
ncbi:high-affinity fructose transporter ght6 [Planoprotostelium fungivorum]|uniref:High-affinity fructose transporter ght6 n=1 Tax=Planoprotostelium fungivorum TaxID=1890364 RepID=A0A2P6P051_9EUKA|nr:high-affinity fructose transporter ght6 [Planoprotostelium fungivorum]